MMKAVALFVLLAVARASAHLPEGTIVVDGALRIERLAHAEGIAYDIQTVKEVGAYDAAAARRRRERRAARRRRAGPPR